MKITGIEGVLRTLQSLPPEVVSKRGGPVKTALRKGALVIQKPALVNLRRSTAGELATGLLEKNLVVTRGKAPSGGHGERYLVRVRRKVYPGRRVRRRGDLTTTLKTAQLLEYGSRQQRAEPWLVPAFKAHAAQAIQTVRDELLRAVDRVVAKLARQNSKAVR